MSEKQIRNKQEQKTIKTPPPRDLKPAKLSVVLESYDPSLKADRILGQIQLRKK